MSKFDFACKIADHFKLDKNLIEPSLVEKFSYKAKRGKDISLNINKLSRDLSVSLPSMDESVAAFYEDYSSGMAQERSEVALK